jgi:BTB/POZ domain-containing protein 9
MLKLSDRFGFELLKDTLGEKLIVEINMENILHLLAYADLYQVTGLLNKCCAFIDQNAEDVLCSDAILTVSDHVLKVILSRDSLCTGELLIFQTVVRWKESNKRNKEEMKAVLECVRLTEIPPRILFGDVERSCLFESESIMKALRVQNLSDFELMRPRGRKCEYIDSSMHGDILIQS